MRYYVRSASTGFGFGGVTPRGVKMLLIINISLFVLYFLGAQLGIGPLLGLFGIFSLIPSWVISGALWQPFTYLFLHSPHGFGHILFNMLALWMFGSDIERDRGTRWFLNYYFFCGVGAGLCDVAARLFMGGFNIPTIGASGAIYGILLAFGLFYPHRSIYLWFLFPIPARYFVAILGGIAFLSTVGASGSGVSHVAHLGGMVFGYVAIRWSPAVLHIDWGRSYQRWKARRARRKFEVYMRRQKRHSRGDWIN